MRQSWSDVNWMFSVWTDVSDRRHELSRGMSRVTGKAVYSIASASEPLSHDEAGRQILIAWFVDLIVSFMSRLC